MQRDTSNTDRAGCQVKRHRRRKRGPTQFAGIVWQAQALGVTRHHLYQVLTGQRKSDRLMRRHAELTGRGA